MRKFLRQLRQLLIRTIVLLAVVYALILSLEEKQESLEFVLWIGVPLLLVTLIYFRRSSAKSKKTYIDSQGYVRIYETNEYEHRHIAKVILNRNLLGNEVVHHINGQRSDNRVKNLCVMDRDQHELFHAWLDWKRKKTRKYPHFAEQKRFLDEVHKGILLESVGRGNSSKQTQQTQTSITPVKDNFALHKKSRESIGEDFDTFSQKLFTELRKERNRLAKEQDVPAYLIFKNFTLTEMARRKPQDAKSMKNIIGVTSEKFRLYGEQFLGVVLKYTSNVETPNDRNSAS